MKVPMKIITRRQLTIALTAVVILFGTGLLARRFLFAVDPPEYITASAARIPADPHFLHAADFLTYNLLSGFDPFFAHQKISHLRFLGSCFLLYAINSAICLSLQTFVIACFKLNRDRLVYDFLLLDFLK
jgi:hypothetical protein